MITTIVSDLSYVILFPKNKTYYGSLNRLNQTLSQQSDYYFFDYFQFNEELLHFYNKIKDIYSLNIFTTDNIQKRPEVKPRLYALFENIYNAKDLEIDKTTPEAYITIASLLKKKPNEILYIDDQQINEDAARQAGLHVVQFVNTRKLINDLKDIH